MPAPTALLKKPADGPPVETPLPQDQEADEELLINHPNDVLSGNLGPVDAQPADSEMTIDEESRPRFAPAKEVEVATRIETRTVSVPPHRFTPLKNEWATIYPPLVEHLKLQVRMNIKKKAVELRTSKLTTDSGAIQKGADFLTAFTLGFNTQDAIALLRLDDLFIQSFEIKDVKTLQGDHQARAIGRLAGKDGKTKFAIENATRTRIVLADTKIHIMGGFKNINIAREACVSLILGKQPGKVYDGLRIVAGRMKERF